MEQTKQRIPYWDNIKGILMVLTVFAHILYQLQQGSYIINSVVDYIYMFHMPAFVFVSGYFGKSERSHSFPAIIKLVFLYFIFNSVMVFLYGNNSLLHPMYSYWYLIALIAWRLSAHHIAKFKEIQLILLVTSLFIGFYPSVDNTFAAARIIGFYPYYMAGYLLSAEKSQTILEKSCRRRFIIGIGSLFVAGVFAFVSYEILAYSDEALLMAGYADPTEAAGRIILYLISFLMIYSLRHLTPNAEIPLLTMFGRNSLWIFLLHRPLTLILSSLIQYMSVGFILACSLVGSLAICILFGNDPLTKLLNRFADAGKGIFTESNKKINAAKLAALGVALCFIFSVVFDFYGGMTFEELKQLLTGEYTEEEAGENNASEDMIYPIMTREQQSAFDDALHITFAGDLILLEDQVKRAYDGEKYDFSDVFEYAKPYISSADYAIGVFEGPMAGEDAGYSSSNFDDSKALYLNYPDAFAESVKDAGFDLVTTANNHLLDKGVNGAKRTLDVLDKVGLDHTGSYRSIEEKDAQRIKLITVDGTTIAVLSYTYGSNYINNSDLINGNLSYITSVTPNADDPDLEAAKNSVIQDFEQAKALSPDLIMVLPHIGEQFYNKPDANQEMWFSLFKECGADIILGDHPHAVEPALLETVNGRTVFTAYCPGNFANIYREKQGDTSMLVDVYIDRSTKKIIGGGVVPLYTQSLADGNYRALPIFEIMNNGTLRSQLSTDDIKRAETAHRIVTNVVFGSGMDISSATQRYYFNENGFLRTRVTGLVMDDSMKNGKLWQALNRNSSVCFIGDSVTEGTKNGGCPWYEPILEHLPDKQVTQYAKGGCTVSYMNERVNEIPDASLYVIALGTNDVRYRDASSCAMTADAYVSALDTLQKALLARNADAKFVFIAPWYSTDGDPFCTLPYKSKTALNEEYTAALEAFCKEEGFGFINANPGISEALQNHPDRKYLLDHIHPNAGEGVLLYTRTVLAQ